MDMTDEVYELGNTHKRLHFCIDQLVKAKDFNEGISWGTEIVHHLTVEEIIGAIYSADEYISDIDCENEKLRGIIENLRKKN